MNASTGDITGTTTAATSTPFTIEANDGLDGTQLQFQIIVTSPAIIDILTTLGLTTNLKLTLDAGDNSSYSGSGQKWLDVSSNGYDFFRGEDATTSNDPVFATNGGIENFNLNGNEWFAYDSANETWMENLHKMLYSLQ